jgi:hypothetical protein
MKVNAKSRAVRPSERCRDMGSSEGGEMLHY